VPVGIIVVCQFQYQDVIPALCRNPIRRISVYAVWAPAQGRGSNRGWKATYFALHNPLVYHSMVEFIQAEMGHAHGR